MTTETKTLKLDDIRIDGGTQPRVAIDQGIVDEYAEKYGEGVDLKPVIVFFDGATYWLADGFHRYWARKRINREVVSAEVHQGTQRDAVLYSVGANATHGLRRTNADKRKAVLTMLEDDEWSRWTDREIAKRCCVNNATVSRARASLLQCNSENTSHKPRTYRTKHGTIARMKTANIGRSSKRKFNPTGGIAKDAFRTRQPHSQGSPVPMRNIDLPLNNPQKAAKCMFSVYGEEYMRALCEELNAIFSKKGISNDNE